MSAAFEYDAGVAAGYDAEPEHALAPGEGAVWRDMLAGHGIAPPAQLLVIGAGTGLLMRALVQQGFQVTGLEPSAAMIAQARGNLPCGATLIHGAAGRDAPVAADGFDAVVMRQVLCHITDPADLFGACLSWLRPGGALVIVDGFWPAAAWSEAERRAQPFACLTDTGPLQAALEQAGFDAVETGPADGLNTLRATAFPGTTPRYRALARRFAKGDPV